METRLHDLAASSDWKRSGDFVIQYGQEILLAALLILVGLVAVKFLLGWLRRTLPRLTENQYLISTVITGGRGQHTLSSNGHLHTVASHAALGRVEIPLQQAAPSEPVLNKELAMEGLNRNTDHA